MIDKPDYCTYKGECLRQLISREKCNDCSYKLKQRILNDDIAEFFYETCRRLRK